MVIEIINLAADDVYVTGLDMRHIRAHIRSPRRVNHLTSIGASADPFPDGRACRLPRRSLTRVSQEYESIAV